MATYREVKGLSVVTMGEGKKVGIVDDVLTGREGQRVRWLRLHDGKLIGGQTSWIPVEAVHGIGEHAVTVDAEADVRSNDEADQAVELAGSGHGLLGKKVITETGTFLGEVRDFAFSADDFALTSVSIARDAGPFSRRAFDIDIQYLLNAGQDVVIVAEQAWSATEASPREQEQTQESEAKE
jgi:uncharacterized protein YrrD